MAIFHIKATTISRGSGRSSCAAAAYRAAEKITDERTGITHDFRGKSGVLYSEIVVPAGSPRWAVNRADLWNHAEQAEEKSTRRATATTAREFNIALPCELDFDANLALVREFATHLVEKFGVAVDFSIHEPSKDGDKRNTHVHVMLSDRKITQAGFVEKVRELNIFNGGKANITSIRERWAEFANIILERIGVHEGIDCRSYKSQGIDRVATIHLGAAVTALERRGIATGRGDRNRAAQAINILRAGAAINCKTIQAQELTATNKCQGAALLERHRHDQQMAPETLRPLAAKMTHEERVRAAMAKAKASKERHLILGLYLGQGRDR